MMTGDSSSFSSTSSPHKARSFTGLPGADQAAALLAELATGSCAYSPALAHGNASPLQIPFPLAFLVPNGRRSLCDP